MARGGGRGQINFGSNFLDVSNEWSAEGEFYSQKISIWEGVRSEFCSRLTAKLQIPQTELPPNSLPTHHFFDQKFTLWSLHGCRSP